MTLNCSSADRTFAVVRFRFDETVSLTDAEMSLHLAMFAVEGLLGRARVRLDAAYELVDQDHCIDIESGTEVGAMIVRVFTGLLLREFGEDSFRIERMTTTIYQIEPERTACA